MSDMQVRKDKGPTHDAGTCGQPVKSLSVKGFGIPDSGMCTEYGSTGSDLSQLPTDLLAEALTESAPNRASFRLVCRDWRHMSSTVI
ncbi:TPA: hypothetical protein ACH3X1_010712 [Trebouxia sp. C0004]